MIQVLDDARDRLSALGRQAAKRADDGVGYIGGLTREASRRADDGVGYLGDLTREVSRRADDSARYAYTKAKTERVSWTMVAGALGVGFVTAFALLNSKKAAVATTTAMSGDWCEVLGAERRRIERLFKQIEGTSDGQVVKRARLSDALSAALTKHALQKENVIYPALRGSDQGASSTHLAAEQFEIKTYLYELEALPKDDPRWMRKLKALQHLVEEHMQEEAETVFPPFHQSLSAAENARLTRAMNREALKLV